MRGALASERPLVSRQASPSESLGRASKPRGRWLGASAGAAAPSADDARQRGWRTRLKYPHAVPVPVPVPGR